ncbi:MAG: UDP-N-acetylglucosamine 2-epimerase (hydrolyzing) [Verrucomicrobiae bacterium]|nr:UDP-N-acetylglucosamine 2-epimerase (hydrolyzing) [Verrucomicrobiae bacterium]
MSRKVCVVTGTRAEYGLLRWVMEGVRDDSAMSLQVIVTGMHLSPEFGLTYREIEADGFKIDKKIEALTSSDTPVGIAKSIGLGIIGFADALSDLKPDLLVVLGDRFEILAAVSAALVACIPVAHLHGGETTEGAFDEAIRHSISKMSHLHFVAAEPYRQRVVQLGEHPDRVFLVGGLGVDAIQRMTLLTRESLEESLGYSLGSKNLLITFHPVTLELESPANQMEELLTVLAELEDTRLIFTLPNADTDGRALIRLVRDFVHQHPNACAHESLGQLRYLSCMKYVDGVVGNSSSGLIEAPSLRTATVNIGDRQRGRLQAESVISCNPNCKSIREAIRRLYSPEFKVRLNDLKNPYGDGGASERIIETLRTVALRSIVKKSFYDLPSFGDNALEMGKRRD